MNFSLWDGGNEDAWDAPEKLLDGEMPLRAYVRHHREARLTDAERSQLADGFRDTFAIDPPRDGKPCDDDDLNDDDLDDDAFDDTGADWRRR